VNHQVIEASTLCVGAVLFSLDDENTPLMHTEYRYPAGVVAL